MTTPGRVPRSAAKPASDRCSVRWPRTPRCGGSWTRSATSSCDASLRRGRRCQPGCGGCSAAHPHVLNQGVQFELGSPFPGSLADPAHFLVKCMRRPVPKIQGPRRSPSNSRRRYWPRVLRTKEPVCLRREARRRIGRRHKGREWGKSAEGDVLSHFTRIDRRKLNPRPTSCGKTLSSGNDQTARLSGHDRGRVGGRPCLVLNRSDQHSVLENAACDSNRVGASCGFGGVL